MGAGPLPPLATPVFSRSFTISSHSYSNITYWWFSLKMRKLIAMEPGVYQQLEEPKEYNWILTVKWIKF